MYRRIICLAFLSCSFFGTVNAQANPDSVTVDAKLERVDQSHVDLVVTCQIPKGLHIYSQTQPKPFLATKITVAESGNTKSIGEFVAEREPIKIKNADLNIELLEYEGTIRWRAKVDIENADDEISIAGSLFAQTCQDDRCFAPESYSFTATLAPGATASTTAPPTEAVPPAAEAAPPAETAATPQPTSPESTTAASPAANDAAAKPEAFSVGGLQVNPVEKSRPIWVVLPLAFIAGFLLNFMPCVLPVVGIKLLSFVQQANADRKRILLMNVAYSGGVVGVMLVLASLAVFAGLGWGEQFSSVGFTVTLSVIVFAFGLSFLGVWEIPIPGFIGTTGSGEAKEEGYVGAFSKGILSTLLATPCSGPFLGAALAWAVTQPSYLTFSVFFAVGIGMASPYLVVGLFPSTIRFLPKPGNWMVTFKQSMGFVMLATVVYLMSFMPVAAVVPTTLLLLGVGVAVWYASRTPSYEPALKQVQAWFIAFVIMGGTAFVSFGWLQGIMQSRFERAAARLNQSMNVNVVSVKSEANESTDHVTWQPYSPDLLEESLRNGKSVFVDFTADWCLTCKANEASAIHMDSFTKGFHESGAVALLADKTQPNPDVDDLLRKLGNSAASIPFYAYFPADDPNNPILLDGVLTSSEPFLEAFRGNR